MGTERVDRRQLASTVGWFVVAAALAVVVAVAGLGTGWRLLLGAAVVVVAVAAAWRLWSAYGRPGVAGAPRAVLLVRGVSAGALVVLAVLVLVFGARAWQRPGWPGVHEADRVPDACTAVPASTVRTAVPGARRIPGPRDADVSACHWEAADHAEGLSLSYERYAYDGRHGGTERAVEVWRPAPDTCPLGDACHRQPGVDGAHETLSVRRANVIVTVQYTGPEGVAALPVATRIARAATAVVVVH